jgi:hypothetical protein
VRPSLILSLVFLATLVAGCGDEESAPKSSGKPSDNMCEAVAPAVPEEWGLTETSADRGKEKTDCTLADEAGDTTVVVNLLKPRSGDVDGAYLGGEPQERNDEQCTLTGPMKAGDSPAQLQRGVRLDKPAAVLWLTFRTNDADHAAGAQDVLGDVESAISEG